MQRFFDILFSVSGLLILSPLLVTLIIVLRVTGEGEIFFLQDRVGFGGQSFSLFKFATMLKNSPNIGTGTVTLYKDPRILPLGVFLRRSKLNELPQLINILKGDMSFIGPRPQTKRCFDAFSDLSQQKIIKVRPGLSGLGSIIFRNEEEMMQASDNPNQFYDNVLMRYKGKLEEWYSDNHNIWTYFILIWLTIWAVLFSNSKVIWKIFKKLPRPPKELERWILQ